MNNKNNKDNSQSPMLLLHNSKTQIINKINDLSFINKQSRNKSNSIKIPINNEKEETQEIDSLTKNQISKLISESKMELNQDEQNEEDNQINISNQVNNSNDNNSINNNLIKKMKILIIQNLKNMELI
jgi:hypothetical protein